jgi:UDP-GlcNAc:undecaprenyl-phosphate/decaprenyl-phosphate GlcNAc-1-phosphate transferase
VVPAHLQPIFTFVVAVGLSIYLAPIVIRAALRYGIVDKPKPPLKTQREPVPYLGGMVIFLAFLLALALTFPFDQRVLAILLASSVVVTVGLIDDLGTLTPKDKLIGQLVAAVVLVKAGVHIELEALPSPVDELVSVFWMVTCMNAFNILDVSDGLATTAAVVGSAGALAVALLNGEPMVAAMAGSLMGASLGFLRVNRQPARMYLGDTGSMLLGCVLGALAMVGRYSDKNVVSSWFVPLAIVAVPLFDLTLVVIARAIARKPIYYGSPDHFAVRLKHHGWQARGVAWTAGALGALVLAVGIGSTFLVTPNALMLLGATTAALVALLVFVLVRFPPKPPAPASTSLALDATAAEAAPVPAATSEGTKA